MSKKPSRTRELVVINQAVNYLTIDIVNAFVRSGMPTTLITGSIHVQGEELDDSVEVSWVNRWTERPAWRKAFSYLLALLRMWWLLMTRYRRHEVLFISVPPMGYLLNLFLPHRFSMVIWDVYPDTFKVTGMSPEHWFYRLWSWLNKKSFASAYRLFTISELMADLLTQYVPREELIVCPLWSIFQEGEHIPKDHNRFISEHKLEGKFIVQYSGNIGVTHNAALLLDMAERFRGQDDVLFQIIGRGARFPFLRVEVERRDLPNVQFLNFQADDIFPHSLSAADLGVVILDERVSAGSVPSKAYNLMSLGIPSLYLASRNSELARYVDEYAHGALFTEDEIDEIAEFIANLARDRESYRQMAQNALAAAKNFRRLNAGCFVKAYF